MATAAGIALPAIRKLERDLGNLTTRTKALNALGWTLRGRNLPAGDSIGRQVAILRKRQKLSQRSLADMTGITQPTVIALEVRNSGRLSVSVTRGTTTEGCVVQSKLAAWTRMRVYPC